MNFSVLIGKKIAALRGYPQQVLGKEQVPLDFLLFTDGETFIEFTEQDKYDFHDYSASARHIAVKKDGKKWQALMEGWDGDTTEHDGTMKVKETDADYSF